MLNKNDFIRNFMLGERNIKANNLYIDNNKIINYNTPIAKQEGTIIYLDARKYSQTTSNNQNKIRQYAKQYGYEVIEVDYNL